MLDKKGVNGEQDEIKEGRGRMLVKECVNGEWVDNDKKNMANDYKDKNIDIQKLVGHGLKIYIYM